MFVWKPTVLKNHYYLLQLLQESLSLKGVTLFFEHLITTGVTDSGWYAALLPVSEDGTTKLLYNAVECDEGGN